MTETWPRQRHEDGKLYVSPDQYAQLQRALVNGYKNRVIGNATIPAGNDTAIIRQWLTEYGWDATSFEYKPTDIVVDWRNEHA